MAATISHTDVTALHALIAGLETIPILRQSSADELKRALFSHAYRRMKESGETFGAASGGLDILNQPEDDFRKSLQRIDNDLGEQVKVVVEAMDKWFTHGMYPPPYYASRIAVILRKAKRLDLELTFLTAYSRHFKLSTGAAGQKLLNRAIKIGALASD